MIQESAGLPRQCLWFTTLLSKAAHLPGGAGRAEAGRSVRELRILDMAQGQKKSRLVAWTFLDSEAQGALVAGRGGRRLTVSRQQAVDGGGQVPVPVVTLPASWLVSRMRR